MKVLIAEDDLTSRVLLKKVLEKWGYEVVVTTNGAEAWEALQAAEAPHLAILDWMMPEMDGVEVCRRARALQTRQPPYLILLTALGERDHMMTAFSAGADDFVNKPYDPAELRARVEVGRRLVDLNAELIEAQMRLEVQAHTDALTGLPNRRAIVELLEKELARSRREHTPLAVGMIDIDHFKRVNDEHGHAAGDAVLCELARRMRSALRPYDSVGRFGGEEFLAFVPGVSSSEFAGLLGRLREVVREAPFSIDGRDLTVTVSLGGALLADESMDALIARADDALYVAKARGRDLVVLAEA